MTGKIQLGYLLEFVRLGFSPLGLIEEFQSIFLFLQFGQAGQSQRKQRMWELGKQALLLAKSLVILFVSTSIICRNDILGLVCLASFVIISPLFSRSPQVPGRIITNVNFLHRINKSAKSLRTSQKAKFYIFRSKNYNAYYVQKTKT